MKKKVFQKTIDIPAEYGLGLDRICDPFPGDGRNYLALAAACRPRFAVLITRDAWFAEVCAAIKHEPRELAAEVAFFRESLLERTADSLLELLKKLGTLSSPVITLRRSAVIMAYKEKVGRVAGTVYDSRAILHTSEALQSACVLTDDFTACLSYVDRRTLLVLDPDPRGSDRIASPYVREVASVAKGLGAYVLAPGIGANETALPEEEDGSFLLVGTSWVNYAGSFSVSLRK